MAGDGETRRRFDRRVMAAEHVVRMAGGRRFGRAGRTRCVGCAGRAGLHRLQLRAHRQIGQRRTGREGLRIHMIEAQRRALQRHRGKRRRFDPRVAGELHAARIELGDQLLERAAQVTCDLHRFIVDLARITDFARERKRLHAIEFRRCRQRPERRLEPVDRGLVMTPVAASMKREARQLRRRRALVQQQPLDPHVAELQLHRQLQILRQFHRLVAARRRRAHARLDRADVQVIDREPPRLARERPAARDAVDLDVGAVAIEAAPAHVAQLHALRERAAVERAGEPAAQQLHGRVPRIRGAAFGRQRAVQQAEREYGEQHQHDHRARDRLQQQPTPAPLRRRRVGRLLPVRRSWRRGAGRLRGGRVGDVGGHA
ncbi:hypothetical protein OKW50_002215 [Paraburkholderia youngii]